VLGCTALGLAAFLAAACLARRIRDAIDDTFRTPR